MPCLHCELPELLEQSQPPDPELVDLIERAFLEGQIASQAANLTYLWLQASNENCMYIQYPVTSKPY